MLRLKKNRKNLDIVICLRERKRVDSLLFLFSLALALLIHLSAFFLFRIKPFKIDSSYIFPTLQMDVEHTTKSVSTQHEEKENLLTFLKAPPEIDLYTFMPLPVIKQENAFTFPDWHNFTAKEKTYTSIKHFSIPLTYCPWEIVISGPLTQLALIHDPTPSKQALTSSPYDFISHQIIFEVQVDGKQGCICWFEKKQGSGETKIDQIAENLLSSLHFAPHPTKAFIRGEIQWNFLEENKKND